MPVASQRRQASNSLRKRLFSAAAASPRATRHPHQHASDLRGRLFVATTGFTEPELTTLVVAAPPVKHIAAAVPPESTAALEAVRGEAPSILGDEPGLRRLPPVQLTETKTSDEITPIEPDPPASKQGSPAIEFIAESPNRYADDGAGAPLAATTETTGSTIPTPPEDEIAFAPIDSPHPESPATAIAILGPESHAMSQIDIVQEPTPAAPSPIAIESNRPSEAGEETAIVAFADAPRPNTRQRSPRYTDRERAETPALEAPLEILIAADPFAAEPSANSLRGNPQESHVGERRDDVPLEIAIPPLQKEVALSGQQEPEPEPKPALPPRQDEIAFAEELGPANVVRLPPTDIIADAAPIAADPVATPPIPPFEVSPVEPAPSPIDRASPPLVASSPLPIDRAPPQVEHPAPMLPLEAQSPVKLAGPAQPSRQRSGVDGLLLHATEARHHVQQGFGAANRGMLYTARKEFLTALQIVAEAKDASRGRRAHMDSLAAGLAAVEEAEKIRDASSVVASVNLSMLVATHRTPALKGQDVSEMLPLAAIDRYHEYAQGQLAGAVAGDPSGSMALYGLARIYEHLGTENGADRVARSRQSVAFHEAALLACPDNFLAAHELGVVLARLGRNEKAMEMLIRSVQLSPSSVAYRNLAVVSRQTGRHQEATVAEQYAEQVARHEESAGESASRVALLEPADFARTSERQGMTQSLTGVATPQAMAAGAGPSPPIAGRPPESGETIVERLAAPLKALSPQSWLGTSRN
jgi:tetratricopeptide (TPR) repeat protein